ncbi:amidase [Nostoc commune]|uniref:amidase n=1 Tax=Nostoc commune TaxID=1178 RepID=UPI0018C5F2A0|nr:amidase [Nostoc commune]MBG1264236.1 amidase [Nostoc commune BAE]MBG1264550.1 amidase [Nostoc commune BAE]MBG1264837.1 amidase [Nostoc commune BAE]
MSEIADLSALSASQLLSLYRDRQLSPVAATKAALERINTYNNSVNAFAIVDESTALAEAQASEVRWLNGNPRGLVDGIPFTVKDLLLTKGLPTRRGSKAIISHQPWEENAPAVARLREQGAVLLGKTTTSEFGWKGVTDSPLTGITRNPWNTDLTPGGSSGGAAVAAALGMGTLHLATDGGGSSRTPAALTGVFGLKPTFGRVSGYPSAHTGSLFHIGVLVRTVTDAALTLNVIAHSDVRDWYALPDEKQDYTSDLDKGVAGLRIAYSPNFGHAEVDAEVAALVKAAVDVFVKLGAIVEEVDPGFVNPRPIFQTFWQAGAAKLLRGFSPEQQAVIEEGLQAIAKEGDRLTLVEYLSAQDAREALGRQMQIFHQNYDLLLTPTLPIVAFPVGQNRPQSSIDHQHRDWTPFTYPFNLTQQPAASLPCGFTKNGLPVGIQIVAAKYKDLLVLQAAKAYESIFPFIMPLGASH